MRPIKLQFWDSESSAMIQLGSNSDFEVFFSKEGEMEIYAVFEGSDGGWEHHQREGAIRQFTGLLDKNGKEIYEGDIIESRKKKGDEPGENIGYIGWDVEKGCYGVYYTPDVSSILFAYESIVSDCKIIGNIYENPELLTK